MAWSRRQCPSSSSSMSPVSILRSATSFCPDRGIGLARHERELVLEQLAHVQVAGVEGQRDQRDVEAARAQPLEQDAW